MIIDEKIISTAYADGIIKTITINLHGSLVKPNFIPRHSQSSTLDLQITSEETSRNWTLTSKGGLQILKK